MIATRVDTDTDELLSRIADHNAMLRLSRPEARNSLAVRYWQSVT